MATKPTDLLNRYFVGKIYIYIYIFEKQWLKKPTMYIFIQNIEQGTLLENLNA